MSEQLFTDGDVQTVGGRQLECVAVSYQEIDGERQNFSYSFRLKSELDAERAAQAEADRAIEEARLATEQPASTEAVSQPEAPEEETQYVK